MVLVFVLDMNLSLKIMWTVDQVNSEIRDNSGILENNMDSRPGQCEFRDN